ncbi:MAG: phosphoribosylglycinamide formyltransferase [Flavobacteriales bacterium]|nr:MAG: phosphoribosylglycinamide formyltransferase [Flavobacteriales bacterium]
MKNLAIFASGSGSNTEVIVRHFAESELARIVLVITDRKDAGVIERMKKFDIRIRIIDKEALMGEELLSVLQTARVDLIVLAGFLRKIPGLIIDAYPNRIINIHPSLLPDYGGKGMYGMNVHKAIIENEEEESGITVHYVNEEFDEGEIIFQETVEIDPDDTAEDLAYKIQQLEHKHYPEVIEWVLNREFID